MNKLALLTIAAIMPGAFIANGGPVAWNEIGGHGGIVPRTQSDIRLKWEKLRIELDDDGAHYKVEAIYGLENNGPAKTLLYGIPLDWAVEPAQAASSAAAASRITTKAVKLASSVQIELNDQLNFCKIDEKSVTAQKQTDAKAEREATYLSGWCLANLKISSGPEVILRLTYHGELEYEDWESSTSPYTHYGKRRLLYKLFPAANWRGPADKVSITIVPGRFAGQFAVSSPSGFKTAGSERIWQGDKVDLKSLDRIAAELDASPQLEFREASGWNRSGIAALAGDGKNRIHPQLAARASSELNAGSGKYTPGKAVDGDPATAWCAAKAAAGEWIEVTLKLPTAPTDMSVCGFHSIALVPGLAKSDALFLDNARPSKAAVEVCGKPETRQLMELSRARVANGPVVEIFTLVDDAPLERAIHVWHDAVQSVPSGRLQDAPLCLRITLLASIPGKKSPDLCLSEVIPVFNCG